MKPQKHSTAEATSCTEAHGEFVARKECARLRRHFLRSMRFWIILASVCCTNWRRAAVQAFAAATPFKQQATKESYTNTRASWAPRCLCAPNVRHKSAKCGASESCGTTQNLLRKCITAPARNLLREEADWELSQASRSTRLGMAEVSLS